MLLWKLHFGTTPVASNICHCGSPICYFLLKMNNSGLDVRCPLTAAQCAQYRSSHFYTIYCVFDPFSQLQISATILRCFDTTSSSITKFPSVTWHYIFRTLQCDVICLGSAFSVFLCTLLGTVILKLLLPPPYREKVHTVEAALSKLTAYNSCSTRIPKLFFAFQHATVQSQILTLHVSD